MKARLAALRYRAGEKDRARTDAAAALATFDANRDQIVNIYRAGTIRPLAEAYQTMGDAATALSIYRRALEEGVENPNSRPRAEDLSATCRSMALLGVEPDGNLWMQMLQIYDALGQPW